MIITKEIVEKFSNKIVQVTLSNASRAFGIVHFDEELQCVEVNTYLHTNIIQYKKIISIKRLVVVEDY